MLMLFDPPSTDDPGKGLSGTASTIDRRQESQKIRRVGVRSLNAISTHPGAQLQALELRVGKEG